MRPDSLASPSADLSKKDQAAPTGERAFAEARAINRPEAADHVVLFLGLAEPRRVNPEGARLRWATL